MRLFATVCAVAALALSGPAFAQQTTGPVTGDQAAANSQSGATAANNNANTSTVGPVTVGPIDASSGPVTSASNSGATSTSENVNLNGGNTVGPIDSSVRVGPTTAVSDSSSGSISGSSSNSQGGNVGDTTSVAQAQGGQGGAGGSSTASATNSATTGPSSAQNTNSNTANPNANNAGNAQNITFNSVAPKRTEVKTNPTVYAPAMTTTLTETCMGSTSGGISVLGFGGTLGTTWNDTQCVRRLNAREMAQTLGDRDAARALLCQDKNVAEAYAAVGQNCRERTVVATYVGPPPPGPVQQYSAPPPAPTATMQPIPNPTSERKTCAESGDGECGASLKKADPLG